MLFIIMALLSLAIVLVQRLVNGVIRQAEAVRVLEQSGATLIDFEWEIDSQGRLVGIGSGEEPVDSNWALSRFAGRVVEISLASCDIGERETSVLREFPRLRVLNCDRVNMPVTAFSSIGVLPSVEDVSFNNTAFGNELATTLSAWPHLKRVSVNWTKIDDTGIAQFSRLDLLNELDVSYTLITSRGLDALGSSQNMTSLDIAGTAIDDHGLYGLHRIASLREVWCTDTRITEKGVSELKRIRPDIEIFSAF
jgi:hypothetical protein